MRTETPYQRRARLRQASRDHARATSPRPALQLTEAQRQDIVQRWHSRAINAQIHALTGEDGATLRDKAGTLIFVILGAALLQGLSADLPELRIIRASTNTLAEIDDHASEQQRASLHSAIAAITRLLPSISEANLAVAAVQAQTVLNAGPVCFGDFILRSELLAQQNIAQAAIK